MSGDDHVRPDGVDDTTLEAVSRLSEALEYVVRARGHLYSVHQLVGRADILAGEAADLLERAGHGGEARRLRDDVVGADVLPGQWTFEIVEAFDTGYYDAFTATEQALRDRLVAGTRHVAEAEMKRQRRTPGADERVSPSE